MKKLTAVMFAGCMAFTVGAYAADDMKKGDAMSKDSMAKDGMKK
jgi:pentapeptide MXKDX repeat protein